MAVPVPSVADLLTTAVTALGGSTRQGQLTMAHAVDEAIATGHHLAVQAGTGTGKSLAYLVPALRHALTHNDAVVISTATIALQRQLASRDLPTATKALGKDLGRQPRFSLIKGRSNYVCLNKINAAPEQDGDALLDPSELSSVGQDITRIRLWAADTDSGDRDDLNPGVPDSTWRHVSVSAKECMGATRCPFGQDCFVEHARAEAARSDIIVTNHALLAIDAATESQVLPPHKIVIIDEAHELADRATNIASGSISSRKVSAAAQRTTRLISQEDADPLVESGENLNRLLRASPLGRLSNISEDAVSVFSTLRNALERISLALGKPRPRESSGESNTAAAHALALSSVEELHELSLRVLENAEYPDRAKRPDVLWLEEDRYGERSLHIAPLSVAGLLRARLFGRSTVVLTSATLTIGGSFDRLASAWGLPTQHNRTPEPATEAHSGDLVDARNNPNADANERHNADGTRNTATALRLPRDNEAIVWHSLDVGSPFEHQKAGILYTAKHLPRPGRGSASPLVFDELERLITAAGGRTLGLFSSQRAATEATEEMRARLKTPILCQSEGSTSELVEEFRHDEETSLFGTLSLWQGVDVPGSSLSLVVIDRIPFPRPDDPLLSARQDAVVARRGNGFLAISASHAALLLAQGAGRLLRSTTDRGVVAILDSRLATAGYSSFLRASLPPFWPTTDTALVEGALSRLASPSAHKTDSPGKK